MLVEWDALPLLHGTFSLRIVLGTHLPCCMLIRRGMCFSLGLVFPSPHGLCSVLVVLTIDRPFGAIVRRCVGGRDDLYHDPPALLGMKTFSYRGEYIFIELLSLLFIPQKKNLQTRFLGRMLN